MTYINHEPLVIGFIDENLDQFSRYSFVSPSSEPLMNSAPFTERWRVVTSGEQACDLRNTASMNLRLSERFRPIVLLVRVNVIQTELKPNWENRACEGSHMELRLLKDAVTLMPNIWCSHNLGKKIRIDFKYISLEEEYFTY